MEDLPMSTMTILAHRLTRMPVFSPKAAMASRNKSIPDHVQRTTESEDDHRSSAL